MRNKILSLMLALAVFASFASPFTISAVKTDTESAEGAGVFFEDFEYNDLNSAKTALSGTWNIEDLNAWGTGSLTIAEEPSGNKYMHLAWITGRLFRPKNIALESPYTFSGRFRTVSGAQDGGVIFVRTTLNPIKIGDFFMNEYETDSYNDGTFTNGVGATGVYLKPQGTKIYVFVRTTETQDATFTKGLGRKFFVADMPNGKNASTDFFDLLVKDNGSKIEIFIDDTFIGSVEYSNLVGGLYTNAVMKDAGGTVMHNITNARIAATNATIAMACRGGSIDFDDIEIINRASSGRDFYLTKSEYSPNEDVVIKYQNTGAKDWVAIVERGKPVVTENILMWAYTEGRGTCLLPADNETPRTKLDTGEYDAVLCINDSYTESGRISFTVVEPDNRPAEVFWWFEDESTVNAVTTNKVNKKYVQTSMKLTFGTGSDGATVDDPWINLKVPEGRTLDTSKYPIMSFKIRKNSASPNVGELYFQTTNSGGYGAAGTNRGYSYVNTEEWQIVNVDMSASSVWKDNLLQVRLDVFGACKNTDSYEIAYVAFFTSVEAANNFNGRFYETGPALIFNTAANSNRLVPTSQTRVEFKDTFARLLCDDNANDPNVNISFSGNTFDAGRFKYVVFRMKSSASADTRCKLYFGAGTQTGPSEASSLSFTVKGDGKWHNYVVNLSAGAWTGNANFIRIDYFDSMTGGDKFTGYYMDVESLTFFETIEEATMFTGYYPANVNTYNFYDTAAGRTPVQVMGSNVLATKFEAKGYLTSLSYVDMPTWSGLKTEFTFRLYKWDTNYQTTIGKAPVFEKVVYNHTDNNECKFVFDTPLEPGRYMAVMTNGKAGELANGNPGGAAGTWTTPTVEGVITFFNGAVQGYSPLIRINVVERASIVPVAKETPHLGPYMRLDSLQNYEYTKNRFAKNDVNLSYMQGLKIEITGADPYVFLPAKDLNLDCSKYKAIALFVVTDKAGDGNFYFSTTQTGLSEATNIPFKYKGTGNLEIVYVNLNSKGNFTGNLKDLRLDVYAGKVDANFILIGYAFFGSVEEAMAFDGLFDTYSMSTNKTEYANGESIEVTVTGNGPKDWVGVVEKGALYTVGTTSSKWWGYVDEQGKLTLSKDSEGDLKGQNLPEGEYDLVYMLNDGYYEFARTTIKVGKPVPYRSDFFTGVGADPVICTTNLAVQFHTTTSFTELIMYCPSWSNNVGNLKFTLYKWDTSYKKTLQGTPVAFYEHVNYPDANPGLSLTFDAQPAGEYLLYIENTSENPNELVGCWASGNFAGTQCYNNGKPIQSALKMTVVYTSQPTSQYNALTPGYSLSVGQMTGGTVTLDTQFAFAGDTIKVTVTPSAGMRLKEGTLKFNGTVINNNEFVMPGAAVTVTAEFEQIPTEPPTEPETNPTTDDMLNVVPLFAVCFIAALAYVIFTQKSKETE